MKATIRRFASPDVNLDSFIPGDPRNVKFLLEVYVGPSDGKGEERFSFEVISLGALAASMGDQDVVFGIHKIIMKEFEWGALKRAVERNVARASGATWDEVASEIGRFGLWEFAS